jgi:hypothetical protein
MNPYKLRVIVEHVRRQGRLPADQFGQTLSAADLIVWFGLSTYLSPEEQRFVKRELEMLAEAEAVSDGLRKISG